MLNTTTFMYKFKNKKDRLFKKQRRKYERENIIIL